MKRQKHKWEKAGPRPPPNFGPCQFCEFEPTTAFCGAAGSLGPTCNMCYERLLAIGGLLRQPEFYVI